MSDLASLLPGIAAVITSVSGGVIGVLAVLRTSKRERKSAATNTVERILNTDSEDESADRRAAIDGLIEELQRQRKDEQP